MFLRDLFDKPPVGSTYQGHADPFGRQHFAGFQRGLTCLAIIGTLLFLAGFFSCTVIGGTANSPTIVTDVP
jgi:hypothetical protein